MQELKAKVMSMSLNEVIEFNSWFKEFMRVKARTAFKKGDKVWFNTDKFGRIEGTVKSVNQKSITVKDTTIVATGDFLPYGYRVSPSLLNKIT